MVTAQKPDVRIFPDLQQMARAGALSIADKISATVAAGAYFHLALSGGNTPRNIYRVLAKEFGDRVRWDQVHLFWGDERYVPHDDPRSNYRLAGEELLDKVRIPAKNVHPMPTNFPNPDDAARAYERTLRDYFSAPWPRFNLVLLGLGADGHTASLFPGSTALEEKKRWVVATLGPAEPRQRLTLTLPVLAHSAEIHFLVAGPEKATALRRAVRGGVNPKSCPAAIVASNHPAVVWWTDASAAALLQKSSDIKSAGS